QRGVRDLGAHRPAALGDRDDGRAAPHARHLRRAAPAAALEPRPQGSLGCSNVSATAFSFEPLFLALAVAAAVLYWHAARPDRPPHAPGRARLSHRCLPRLVVPRPRLHLLEPAVLRVLRARAATVGAVADPRPEPRRDPDERRTDARLPVRDRLVRAAAA